MTFKELLNEVRFEDVAPYLLKMYPHMADSLGWFKIHFDMLRGMTPQYHEDANDKVCRITLTDWKDGTGFHLDAYPMEGDLWEHSLTKELVIGSDVRASDEEIAACCLWHTSFYGFVPRDLDETFEKFARKMDSKSVTQRNCNIIRKYGGTISTLGQLSASKKQELIRQTKGNVSSSSSHLNKSKKKRLFRHEFMELYYDRMAHISDFIVQSIPALDNGKNYLTTKQLCGLFHSEKFCSERIISFANAEESAINYLLDVISRYKMVPEMDGIVIHLITGTEHDTLSEEEKRLCHYLSEGRRYSDLILSTDSILGNQATIHYAVYNSKISLFS